MFSQVDRTAFSEASANPLLSSLVLGVGGKQRTESRETTEIIELHQRISGEKEKKRR